MNMKLNKIILYSFVLLVLLFSVTAISAADLNDTSDVSDVLKDDGDSKSFIDLNNDIASEDFSLILNQIINLIIRLIEIMLMELG